LYFLLSFAAARRQLCCHVFAVADVPQLLFDDLRQNARERFISAGEEFLQLIATYPVDQKSEDRKSLPGIDDPSKGIQVALLIGPTEDERYVHSDVAGDTGDLAKMIHLLGSGARYDQLFKLARSGRQYVFYIQMGTANFTIGLNGRYSTQ